jgi:hypothetical protein
VLDQKKHRHADQSDMLHTVKPGADCTAEEESDKGDKLQALIGVVDTGSPLREKLR